MEAQIVEKNKKRAKEIEKLGKQVYRENDFVTKIYEIMQSDVFNEFYDTYIHTHNDVNVMIIFMNTYKVIQEQYKNIFNRDISKYQMLYYLRESMRHKSIRKYFISNASDKNLLSYKTEFNNGIKDIIRTNLIKE